jgi:hypothetical protein
MKKTSPAAQAIASTARPDINRFTFNPSSSLPPA